MSDTPMTQRWVAGRDSAQQAAGAFLRLAVRRRRWWMFIAAVEILFALVIGLSIDDRFTAGTRVVWGVAYASVLTLVIAGVTLGAGYFTTRRRFRQRLREGVVLESGFGEGFLVLRGPWSESTLAFDGIESLQTTGDWMFLQQRGSPLLNCWPAQLFPPADLAHLRRSIETR